MKAIFLIVIALLLLAFVIAGPKALVLILGAMALCVLLIFFAAVGYLLWLIGHDDNEEESC